MCKPIDLANFRKQTFTVSMARVRREAATLEIKNVLAPLTGAAVRAAALANKLDRLAVLLREAAHFAERADLFEAMDTLNDRRREVERLQADARRFNAAKVPTVEVQIIPEDFGKKGRGAKIRAAILARGLTWEQVAAEFVLAKSTAQKYVREARKVQPLRIAA